jgi:glycosyltransferase involved in cell wall biosynthesis
MKPSISVVIPVYNGISTLTELIERLDAELKKISRDYEIILINDGSPDQSWQLIEALSVKYRHVQGINLMQNYGQHNAIFCGLMNTRFELIATLDDDLQHPPEEIIHLLDCLNQGYDVVYGTPKKETHGLFRDLASVFTKLILANLMGAKNARSVGPFRVFKAEVFKAFSHYQGPYVNIDVLLSWGTNKFGSIPVNHLSRSVGKSNYNFRKLMNHTMNLITGFSTLPLQMASMTGFGFTIIGFVILIYVLVRNIIFGVVVPGFTFLSSIIAIFSGATLFALGIIGEYLARMYFRLMDKPKYWIKNKTK